MFSGGLKTEMGPGPLLSVADRCQGTWLDYDTGIVVTSSELASGRQWLVAQLRRRGVVAGDRLVVAVGNGPSFLTALLSTLQVEAAPLLVHSKTPATELKRMAATIGARFVLCDELEEAELRPQFDQVHSLSGAPWLQYAWAEWEPPRTFSGQSLDLRGIPLHPTSGTTGVPKIALRPGMAALEEARHYIEAIGIDQRDTVLVVSPMSHAYAFGMGVMVPLLSGASVVSVRSFSAKSVLQALGEHPITVLPAVPAMLDVLMFGSGGRLQNPNRRVFTAGSPLSERTARRFRELAGDRVRPLYGTTETGGISVALADQELAVGCVGRPMTGVEVAVLPSEDATDTPGLLQVRSSSMMAGYLGREGLDESLLNDGWFTTGDLAIVDDEGFIHLKGRASDVINVAGMKVVPLDVEEVVAAFPGVVEVKVYPGQTRAGSQYVKAAVVVEENVTEQMIRAHCERHLVYYKRPDRIAIVSALPRSPAGKILRDQLP